jgi:hypothetical protein
MNLRTHWILVAIATALACEAAPLLASDTAASKERYGTPADHKPFDREIRIGADNRSVGVWRLETIHFRTQDGGEFTWTFDTLRPLDVFALERIAPAAARVSPATTIYVNRQLPVSGTF